MDSLNLLIVLLFLLAQVLVNSWNIALGEANLICYCCICKKYPSVLLGNWDLVWYHWSIFVYTYQHFITHRQTWFIAKYLSVSTEQHQNWLINVSSGNTQMCHCVTNPILNHKKIWDTHVLSQVDNALPVKSRGKYWMAWSQLKHTLPELKWKWRKWRINGGGRDSSRRVPSSVRGPGEFCFLKVVLYSVLYTIRGDW